MHFLRETHSQFPDVSIVIPYLRRQNCHANSVLNFGPKLQSIHWKFRDNAFSIPRTRACCSPCKKQIFQRAAQARCPMIFQSRVIAFGFFVFSIQKMALVHAVNSGNRGFANPALPNWDPASDRLWVPPNLPLGHPPKPKSGPLGGST